MDDVDELVIIPFREIVEKGKLAIENAGDRHPIMAKAAQALVKEGERGLKRIEPLCRKQFEDYGIALVAALKDNDEIAKYRTELTDLLWEFDDYIELETFAVDKFAELQTASRKAAPKIYDILMRMKLDISFRDDMSSRGSVAQLPTPTSPPMIPASLLSLGAGGSLGIGGSASSFHNVDDATAQMRKLLQQANFDEAPPRPPSTNPWDYHTKPSSDGRAGGGDDGESVFTRPGDESPVLPSGTPGSEPRLSYATPQATPNLASATPSEHGGSHDGGEDHRLSNISTSSHNTFGHGFQRQKSVMSSFSIPEDSVSTQQNGMIPYFQTTNAFSPVSLQGRQAGMSPPMGGLESTTMSHAENAPAPTSAATSSPPPSGFSTVASVARPMALSAADLAAQPGLEVVQVSTSNEQDLGPIPVESERPGYDSQSISPAPSQFQASHKSGTTLGSLVTSETLVAQCDITDASSIRVAKGFCDGAAEVIRGGIGVKRTKKPGFASSATVARCIHCLYELDFPEIEKDVNKEERGNYTRNGINFRVRFLQKSHIATKRVDDVQYACVFCVQAGRIVDRSDATVFFNQKALFDHLARHSRPLPNVPGVTVIDGPDIPTNLVNDYDIHFRGPTQRHPCVDRAAELSHMPSGVAKDQARRMYGQRLLYDRSPALELAQGARVVGITWPIQYQGEWCFGWHDGKWASVPTDLLKLDMPPPNMIKYDRTSLVRGKARWKFVIKERDLSTKTEWLRFDKGEIITNISWVDSEHWCWTGTNSKGKTGIFPQAYIDTTQLQEPESANLARVGSLSEEKARSSGGFMSKLGMRKASTVRPPSAAGSTHSHETSMTSASAQRRFAAPGDGSSIRGWG